MFMQYRNPNGTTGAVATGYVICKRGDPAVVEKKTGKCPCLSFCITTDRVTRYDRDGNAYGQRSIYCNCVLYYFPSTAGIYEMVKRLQNGSYVFVAGHVFDQFSTTEEGAKVRTPRLFCEVVMEPDQLALSQMGVDKEDWNPPKMEEKEVELDPSYMNENDEYDFK